MEFHEILSKYLDADGPIKIERGTSADVATFTPADDTGRVLLATDTNILYYGDNTHWVEINDASSLTSHASLSAAHGSDGNIVGMNTLTNYSLATTAARGFLNTLSGNEDEYLNGLGNWNEIEKVDSMKVAEISQTGHGFAVGDVVRLDGSNYVKAIATNPVNAEVVGIVSEVTSNDVFVLTLGGYVDGLSGLVAGTPYFLSDTISGGLTSIEPTGSGMVSKPLLIAPTATTGYFFNMRGSVVSAPSIRTYVNVRIPAPIENVTGLSSESNPIPGYVLKYEDYTVIEDTNSDFQGIYAYTNSPTATNYIGAFIAPEDGKYLFTGEIGLSDFDIDHHFYGIAGIQKNWQHPFAYIMDDPGWYTYEPQRQFIIGGTPIADMPGYSYFDGISWCYSHIINMEAGDFVHLAVCVWGDSKTIDITRGSMQVVRVG